MLLVAVLLAMMRMPAASCASSAARTHGPGLMAARKAHVRNQRRLAKYQPCDALCQVHAFAQQLPLAGDESWRRKWEEKYPDLRWESGGIPALNPLGEDMKKALGWGGHSVAQTEAALETEVGQFEAIGENAGTHAVYASTNMAIFVKFMPAAEFESWQGLSGDYQKRMAAAWDETKGTWRTLLPRILLVGGITTKRDRRHSRLIAFTSAVPMGAKLWEQNGAIPSKNCDLKPHQSKTLRDVCTFVVTEPLGAVLTGDGASPAAAAAAAAGVPAHPPAAAVADPAVPAAALTKIQQLELLVAALQDISLLEHHSLIDYSVYYQRFDGSDRSSPVEAVAMTPSVSRVSRMRGPPSAFHVIGLIDPLMQNSVGRWFESLGKMVIGTYSDMKFSNYGEKMFRFLARYFLCVPSDAVQRLWDAGRAISKFFELTLAKATDAVQQTALESSEGELPDAQCEAAKSSEGRPDVVHELTRPTK